MIHIIYMVIILQVMYINKPMNRKTNYLLTSVAIIFSIYLIYKLYIGRNSIKGNITYFDSYLTSKTIAISKL